MRGVFITGTDTGVGKTWISCALLRGFAGAGLRSAGMKPVASGAAHTADGLRNADALAIQQSAGVELAYELINPYVFEPPIAPHIAAAEAGIRIDLPTLLDAYAQLSGQADVVVVEGVGGWMVPLGDDLGLPDLARALGLPVIMVVGMRLGCLNHALLTARAIRDDGLRLAGWIANQIEADFPRMHENMAALGERLTVPLLGEIPYLSAPQDAGASIDLAAAVHAVLD